MTQGAGTRQQQHGVWKAFTYHDVCGDSSDRYVEGRAAMPMPIGACYGTAESLTERLDRSAVARQV